MELSHFWFILIAVLWTGYLVLEGFDFGVGMLLPVLDKTGDPNDPDDTPEKRRRVMLNTIGPFWDGNEVWLLTAGGSMFAAFPHWYATMFSGMYLALLVLLVVLILRNMGFEYRHKRDSDAWRRGWDYCIIVGSFVAPLLVGVALTNIVNGLPIDAHMEFTGNLLTLLNPISLLGGIVVVGLSLTHGAHFIALKTAGKIREDARAVATKAGVVTAVLAVVLLLWLGLSRDGSPFSWATTILAAVALLAALWFNHQGKEGYAFTATALTILLAVTTYFVLLFPNVMPTTLADGTDLTIVNAASSTLTLKIMTGAALIFTPIMLLYTAWNYWVFRRRIRVEQIPDPVKVS
ncbi:cytochrome d ubiquinol oxidase subunit II [Kribbia dieselivorans]|uniref:cytochrome d ubiquinol oxidase subunit II n=1 Tax=Kribbia dieselivorans TaxID=331526 RepID=UPI000839721F|nr:cytochrome d ubiquinol oxidase subunit II [Kribbia dieselivorans]